MEIKFKVAPVGLKPTYHDCPSQVLNVYKDHELLDAKISVIMGATVIGSLDTDEMVNLLYYDGKDKAALMEMTGKGRETYDYALPQPWVDEWCKKLKAQGVTYDDLIFGFVWLYDEEAKTFGRPFPLTNRARFILELIQRNPPVEVIWK